MAATKRKPKPVLILPTREEKAQLAAAHPLAETSAIIRPWGITDGGDPAKFVVEERKKLLDRLGDISSVDVMWDRVLVVIWQAPAVKYFSRGATLHRTDASKDEDIFQGTIALIVAMGPSAYKDDTGNFVLQHPDVGNFVIFRRGYGTRVKIRGVHGVLFEEPERAIQAVIKRLDVVDVM